MKQLHSAKPGHAIVIGGSIVGSIVAAMLAERFKRVTILERDSIPPGPEPRPAVPQARHVHALLTRGSLELERLFPGFLSEMADAGALMLDIGRDAAWLTPAGWGVAFESGFLLCCATRSLIEWHARRRTMMRGNVALLDGMSVTGLITDPDRSRVVGVRVRDRHLEAGMHDREVRADFIVDCTGRGSQLPEWLVELGRPRVREEIVDAGVTYASRFYALPEGALGRWRAAYVQAALPHDPRGGILIPVEQGRWHLTLLGYGNVAPPVDEAGFVAFMQGLRSPILADALRHATPLTPIVTHRRTQNQWRHFEEIGDWPDGLVAAGDSVCCFDPVYGQGMTTGILGALALAARFDREWDGSSAAPAGFARRVQQQMVRVVRPAWNLATGEDLRLSSTTGGHPRMRDRLLQCYFDRVVATSTSNPRVRRRLLAVMNMVTGPEAMLHPKVVAGVTRFLCGRTRALPPLWPEGTPSTLAAQHDSSLSNQRAAMHA